MDASQAKEAEVGVGMAGEQGGLDLGLSTSSSAVTPRLAGLCRVPWGLTRAEPQPRGLTVYGARLLAWWSSHRLGDLAAGAVIPTVMIPKGRRLREVRWPARGPTAEMVEAQSPGSWQSVLTPRRPLCVVAFSLEGPSTLGTECLREGCLPSFWPLNQHHWGPPPIFCPQGLRSPERMPAVFLAGSPQRVRLWGLPRGDWSDPIPIPAT